MGSLKKRLMRNPHRGRLGGVCAGLSDYTGVSQTLFRLLFLISLLFGGFGLWIYLILWLAIPAQDNIPITGASLGLRWQIYRLGRQISRIHRTQVPSLADRAQLAYDAIRRLSPRIDPHLSGALNHEIARLALVEFPSLLDQVDRAGHLMSDAAEDERIQSLHLAFVGICNELIEASSEILEPMDGRNRSPEHQELASFQTQFQDLTRQLPPDTSSAITNRLEQIESHINQLLRIQEEVWNELGPFRSHEIRRIAFGFLPETLQAYLRIQGPLVRTQVIRDHKTAEDLFKEQLDLLDQALEGYSRALLDRDTQSLLVQGHFLREKFGAHPAEVPPMQPKDTDL